MYNKLKSSAVLLLLLLLLTLLPTTTRAGEVVATTSPFASLPNGTPLSCSFEKETNQLRCLINSGLTYGISWDALTKERDKGLFRLYATPLQDLVTELVDYGPGQLVTVWVVWKGERLPQHNTLTDLGGR